MFAKLILAIAVTSTVLLFGPMTSEADAGRNSWRTPRRTYNQFQRSASRYQRQYQRNYRSFNRNYSRSYGRSQRGYRSDRYGYTPYYGSGVQIGNPRAGVYFRF